MVWLMIKHNDLIRLFFITPNSLRVFNTESLCILKYESYFILAYKSINQSGLK